MIKLIEWDSLKNNDTVYMVSNLLGVYAYVKVCAFIGPVLVPCSTGHKMYFAVYDSSDNKLLMIEKDNSSFFISREDAYENAIMKTQNMLHECNKMVSEQLEYLKSKLNNQK